MKWFLIASFALLVLALLVVIGVFVYLNTIIVEPSTQPTRTVDFTSVTEMSNASAASSSEEGQTAAVSHEGIPLRTLPLSDGQREAIELVGIDVETFVITPGMVSCAEDRLGVERMNAIISGDAPTFMETTRMVPCLSGN